IRARGQAARRRRGSLTPRYLPRCDMTAPRWAAQNAAPRARSSCHNAHRIKDFLEFTLAKHVSFVPDLVYRALYTQGGRLRFLASAPLSAPTPSLTPSSPRPRGGDIDETARLSRAGRSRARLHRQEPAMRGPRARPDRAESTIGTARDIAVLRRRRALE